MNNDSYTPPIEIVIHSVVPVLFIVIIILGLVGNLLVILVFALNRALQDSTNLLIINLAIADLLFILLCVPFTAVQYATAQWPFARQWCCLMVYFQHVSALSSVWTLVLMALDRFLAVVFPVQALTWRNLKNTFLMCMIVWIIFGAANLPLLWLIGLHEYNFAGQNRSLCVYLNHIRHSASKTEIRWFYWSFTFGAYIVPLIMTCVLYGFLVRSLWKGPFGMSRLKKEQKMSCEGKYVRNSRVEENLRNKRRVTQMVALVTATFAVCWLLQNCRFLYIGIVYPHEESGFKMITFQITAQVLAYVNSCLNPLIYGVSSENFRRGLQNVVRMILRKPQQRITRKATIVREPSRSLTAHRLSFPLIDIPTPRIRSSSALSGDSGNVFEFPKSRFRSSSTATTSIERNGIVLSLYGNCLTTQDAEKLICLRRPSPIATEESFIL